MKLAHLVAFNLTLLAAIASLMPSLPFLTKPTLESGHAAAITAVLVVTFPQDLILLENFIIFSSYLATELVVQTLLVIFLSIWVIRHRYLASVSILDRITATIPSALGGASIFDPHRIRGP